MPFLQGDLQKGRREREGGRALEPDTRLGHLSLPARGPWVAPSEPEWDSEASCMGLWKGWHNGLNTVPQIHVYWEL